VFKRCAKLRLVAAALRRGGLGFGWGRKRLALSCHAGAGFRDLRLALLGDRRWQRGSAVTGTAASALAVEALGT